MIGVVAVVVGVGLVSFWTWGLVAGGVSRAPEPWPGFRDHELAFAPVDLMLGAALIAAGVAAPTWLPVCGGGLLFLGSLDAAYLARTWRLRSVGMKVRTGVLSFAALLAGALCVASAPGWVG